MYPKKLLVIYTGGTIGMMQPPNQTYLQPVDFQNIRQYLPEVDRLGCEIEFYSFDTPIDSSSMEPKIWVELVQLIGARYHDFDGFVILHGTDTMSYSASALSFMLEGLKKPVILTGSQLPVAVIRTDARENLITALEIASHPFYTIAEVCIFFGSKLMRGNRTLKYSSEHFQAFISPNYPLLAEAGVNLTFHNRYWLQVDYNKPFVAHTELSEDIALLKFYPGINQKAVEATLNIPSLRGVVLETFGAGNLPDFDWLIKLLKKHIENGLIVLNISQCFSGAVNQERYKNSNNLMEIGVISGGDMTTEAALAKLMYLLGKYSNLEEIRTKIKENLSGEISTNIMQNESNI